MSESVYFMNSGEIDILAVTTMGIHVKESTNPIGHFGTGLKYAIATLLRTGHRVTVWRGDTKFEFGTEEHEVRGKPFQFVTMNGERLGFTTETGKNWEVWMAYRELRCNAMDEANWTVAEVDGDMEGVPDYTIIQVFGLSIVTAHQQRSLYFVSEGRLLLHTLPGVGEIYAGGSDVIFYRGVAALKLKEPSLFTYNILETCPLTEDRTLKETWWIPYIIGKIVSSCTSEEVAARIIEAPDKTYERMIDFSNGKPSQEFLNVARVHKSNVRANSSAIMLWAKTADVDDKFVIVEPTEEERVILSKGLALCYIVDPGFNATMEDIHMAESLGEGVLGLYSLDKIYISRNCVDVMGLIKVAGTILEEWVHKTHGYKDNTRSMQDYFQDRLMRLAAKEAFDECGDT